MELDPVPASSQVNSEGSRPGRRCDLGRRDPADLAQCLEDVGGRLFSEISNQAVVGKNSEVIAGKQHRQKPVVLLIPSVAGIRLAPLPSCSPGTGGTMV